MAVRARFTCVLSRTAGRKRLPQKTYLRQQGCNGRVTFTASAAARRVCMFLQTSPCGFLNSQVSPHLPAPSTLSAAPEE